MEHYAKFLQESIRRNWLSPALSDYQGETLTYHSVAVEIEKLHLLFEACNMVAGDKMVLCARNSVRWATTFLSIATYRAVAVPLLNEFLPADVVKLTAHSDSKILFVDDSVWSALCSEGLERELVSNSTLQLIVNITDYKVLYAASPAFEKAVVERDELFLRRHPDGFSPSSVTYTAGEWDDVVIISYTSGTTSAPKGVMLTARSLSSNITYSIARMPNQPGWTVLSMLPMAHLYGLVCDFLYPLSTGCHIYFLGKTPTPTVLIKAFAEVKPYMILMVPLVIEKIFRSKIFPTIEKPFMRFLMSLPGIRQLLLYSIKRKLLTLFGGHLYDGLVLGGAAINEKVERLLHEMHLPYTVGYGMTECGPLICYEHFDKYKMRSCGRAVWNLELKVNSANPESLPGEIWVKGANVMKGYYKNEEATREVLTADGWLKTGDMGIVDHKGHVFIKGRCKNMLLGPNGQNIYPEEIEDKVNVSPYVAESLVVKRNGALTALIVPDVDALKEVPAQEVNGIFEDLMRNVNLRLPAYCRLSRLILREEPFEKTPKRSIKRFLYNEE